MKKLKSIVALALTLMMIFTYHSFLVFADAGNRGVSVEMSPVSGSEDIYKLTFAVKNPLGFNMVDIAFSYDNTLIAPVRSDTYAEVDITDRGTARSMMAIMAYDQEGDLFTTFGALWRINESTGRTAFKYTVNASPGSKNDSSDYEDVFAFYFKFQDGKTSNDLNADSFRFENGAVYDNMLSLLTASAGITISDGESIYYWGHANPTSSTNIIDDSNVTFSDNIPNAPEPNQGEIEITELPSSGGTYGDTLAEMQLTGGAADSGNTTGSWEWLNDGSQNPSGIYPTAINPQSYKAVFTPSDGRPAVVCDVTPVVTPLTITVTANTIVKHEGDDDPELTFTISPSLVGNDMFTGALERETGESIGIYPIGKGGLELDENYNLVFIGANFRIIEAGKEVQNITIDNPGDKIYGDGSFDLNINPPTDLDTFEFTSDRPDVIDIVSGNSITFMIKGAGTATISAYKPGNDQFSDFEWVHTLNVAKAELTVVADDQIITYGDDMNRFAFSYKGFVNGDDGADLDSEPEAYVESDKLTAGIHPIRLLGGVSNNYDFLYEVGALTVNPKEVSVIGLRISDKAYQEDDVKASVIDSGYIILGKLSGDDVRLDMNELTAEFSDDSIGDNKLVTVNNLLLVGNDSGNYSLSSQTAYAAGNIIDADNRDSFITWEPGGDAITVSENAPPFYALAIVTKGDDIAYIRIIKE